MLRKMKKAHFTVGAVKQAVGFDFAGPISHINYNTITGICTPFQGVSA